MPRKSKKPEKELRADYEHKVERTVVSLDRQYAKLRRAFKSKKADLSDDQKAYVLDHIRKTAEAFEKAISGESKEMGEFKLP